MFFQIFLTFDLLKENLENFIWYEYFIEKKQTIHKQGDFKTKSGVSMAFSGYSSVSKAWTRECIVFCCDCYKKLSFLLG